jgi:hypothetical protein
MPYQYLTGAKASPDSSPINGAQLANDFWAIQLVSSRRASNDALDRD